jgi:hypothetical protein
MRTENFRIGNWVYNSDKKTVSRINYISTIDDIVKTEMDGAEPSDVLEYFDIFNPKHRDAEIAPTELRILIARFGDVFTRYINEN